MPALKVAPGLRRALPGVLFALLVVGAYADPLFFRRNFSGRDLIGYMLPIEKSIHDAYARGRLPVWIPEISGGRPLAANPNVGALYPVRILHALLPFPLAMRTFPVIHWILAGWGMILLLRSLNTSPAGAWLGAVTYAFSAVSVGEVFFPNIQPGMALLPWVVWAVARPETDKRKVLLISLLFAVLLLAGDVFTTAIALGACLLWILFESPAPQRPRDSIHLAFALVLAGLLAAPQIFATILWIPETNRAVLGMKLYESLFFTLSPFRLTELVVPFLFGQTWRLNGLPILGWRVFGDKPMGFFASLYAGALAVVALFEMWKRKTRGVRFARALLLVGLAASVGPSLFPKSWGELASPVPLRYPEKFVVASIFSLAILAGIAVDRLRTAERLPRWLLGVGVFLALLAFAAALFPEVAGREAVLLFGGAPDMAAIAGRQLSLAFAEGGLLWMITVVALSMLRRREKVSFRIALLLLTAVPIAANRRIAPAFRQDEVFGPTPFARFISKADPSGSYRTLGESSFLPSSKISDAAIVTDEDPQRMSARDWNKYTQVLWNRGTVFNVDFDRGDFSRLESLRRFLPVAAGPELSNALFGSLALRFGIRYRDQNPLGGYRRAGGNGLQDWDEHAAAFPEIRLVEKWRETPGGLPALNEIGRLEPGEILVETGQTRRGNASPGRLRIVEKSPERLVVETNAPQATWLFVLRGYWTQRTVLLDDVTVEALPAQLAFSALSIPAGFHRIDWRERLPGSSVSWWGPVLFTLFAVLLLVRERRSA
ncbi:MAG TPA: hypothetical protein VGK86_09360 [Thermoanaerobaculia bacterium]